MFAIVETGGKQYKVTKHGFIKVEKINAEKGTKINLDRVLMIGESSAKPSFIGTPLVKGAYVTAEIADHVREPKILVFKKRRRKNYRRKIGHRQEMTQLKILDISKE